MKYNSGGFTPPEKKSFGFTVISIFIFIAINSLCIIGLVWLAKKGNIEISMESIVSVIAVVISLSTILVSVVQQIYETHFSTKKIIELDVETQDNTVVFSGTISNMGHKRILNKNVYLVVSKGILRDGVYSFGLPLEHEDDNGTISHDEAFCIYSKLMHITNIERCTECSNNRDCFNTKGIRDKRTKKIMKRYNNKVKCFEYHRMFVFEGLSKASRLFVDAGEEFSDEIVLNLEVGTYRSLMIWIPEGKEDCACSVKYFNVKGGK